MIRRAWLLAGTGTALVAGLTLGANTMGWFKSDRDDLKDLLGSHAAALLGPDARLAAWAPDPDHKPVAYYLTLPLAEAALRAWAAAHQLTLQPTPAAAEGIWRLPAGVQLAGWHAPEVAAGAGWQARASLPRGGLWLRWQQGTAWVVVQATGG
jgi:hypothetical protein